MILPEEVKLQLLVLGRMETEVAQPCTGSRGKDNELIPRKLNYLRKAATVVFMSVGWGWGVTGDGFYSGGC